MGKKTSFLIMIKIAFFEIKDWEQKFLKEKLEAHTLYFDEKPLTKEKISLASDAEILSTFIYSQLSPDLLEDLPALKLIATRSTGFDHIDIDFCKKKGIVVCNVPSYGAHTVAEHTFALILAISRKLVSSVNRTKKGNFSIENLSGYELFGKTLGVIGVGNIGREVIKIANGFGMNVLAFSKHQNRPANLKLKFVDLPTLLSSSNIISLHIPYNSQTHHFINKTNINQFKKGSILINTARGGIVETEAILHGLDSGILAGVGLDVLEEECFLKEEPQLLTNEFLNKCNLKTQLLNHVLLTRDNVIITPHNAFNSKEALREILETTAENILSFLSGKPKNAVNS